MSRFNAFRRVALIAVAAVGMISLNANAQYAPSYPPAGPTGYDPNAGAVVNPYAQQQMDFAGDWQCTEQMSCIRLGRNQDGSYSGILMVVNGQTGQMMQAPLQNARMVGNGVIQGTIVFPNGQQMPFAMQTNGYGLMFQAGGIQAQFARMNPGQLGGYGTTPSGMPSVPGGYAPSTGGFPGSNGGTPTMPNAPVGGYNPPAPAGYTPSAPGGFNPAANGGYAPAPGGYAPPAPGTGPVPPAGPVYSPAR